MLDYGLTLTYQMEKAYSIGMSRSHRCADALLHRIDLITGDRLELNRSDKWLLRIRVAFWIIGIASGAFLAYTTRFFLNGDGINYIEMGEALRHGQWWGLVNLTESPGYAFWLGIAQIVLDTSRANELEWLKAANFAAFVVAMGASDLLVHFLKRYCSRNECGQFNPLPFPALAAICYAMFLFSCLSWIRLRLVAPELLVFVFMLTSTSLILWIREAPNSYAKYVLLGVSLGLGYLCKTFFFIFAGVFFALAVLVSDSLKKGVPRVLVSVLAMLLVSAPLILALSSVVGRFSYGEVGNLSYSVMVDRQGDLLHPPKQLHAKPEVLFYLPHPFAENTRPAGFDQCYWFEGVKASFNPVAQLKVVHRHVFQILSDSPSLFLAFCLWLAMQWWIGRLGIGPFRPLSAFLVFFAIGGAGTGLFCLVHVEIRYLACFLYLGFVALALLPSYDPADAAVRRKAIIGTGVLVAFILALIVNTVIDQTTRALCSTPTKPSYKEMFGDTQAVADTLAQKGLSKGDRVAMVGLPLWYWARLGQVEIVAEIPDEQEFLAADSDAREKAVKAMRAVGVKAVVGKGPAFGKLGDEGWQMVPGTRDFFLLVL